MSAAASTELGAQSLALRKAAKQVEVELAVSRYIEHLHVRNLRPWTIYNRQRAMARVSAWFGGRPILRLTYEELSTWQVARSKQIQPEPLRTEMSNLRQFYRWARRERLIRQDPTERLILPKVNRGLPRPIRDTDLSTAIEGADIETGAMLALAAFAGLRACEIAGLDWSNVGIGEEHPRIRVVDGKGGHGRIVPISVTLETALRQLPTRRGPVIRRGDGNAGPNQPHRISSRANDYLHSIGLADTLHKLRHRFATATYQACLDIRAVQDLMGHASPVTTSRYAAVASAVALRAVEAAGTLGAPGDRSWSSKTG